MAGSKSDYAELKVLELLVGKTAFTLPTAYVALFTVAPSDPGGGTEVVDGSYARKVTAGSDWSDAAAGHIDNAEDIIFVEATADWGEVVAFATYDAISGGNMLHWGDLTTPKTIESGEQAKFPAGSLDFTED